MPVIKIEPLPHALGIGERILREVCKEHGVDVREVKSPSRGSRLVLARHAAAKLMREEGLIHKEIATVLRRDVSTVNYMLYGRRR